MKKKVLVGLTSVVLAVVLVFGGVTFYNNRQQEKFDKQMASFESVDTMKHPKETTVKINGVEVPLSSSPKVTTKKTTKKSTKVKTLKKKASKSKVVTTKKTKTTKKTTQSSSQRKVVDTKVVTTTKDYDKKGSKKRTVKTTIVTTVKTTTVKLESGPIGTTVRTLGSQADKKILDAFESLQFKLVINKNAEHTGLFSVKSHKIEIQTAKSYVLLHELGHFANFIAGDKVSTDEWKSIYNSEKSKYTGYNKDYVTKTASEYFAESYRDYKEDPSALKSKRPKTYKFVKKTIDDISDSDVQNIRDTYAEYWGL